MYTLSIIQKGGNIATNYGVYDSFLDATKAFHSYCKKVREDLLTLDMTGFGLTRPPADMLGLVLDTDNPYKRIDLLKDTI